MRDLQRWEHPETVAAMNNLALTLSAQEKYKETVEMLEETLELAKRVFDPGYPKILQCTRNLSIKSEKYI